MSMASFSDRKVVPNIGVCVLCTRLYDVASSVGVVWVHLYIILQSTPIYEIPITYYTSMHCFLFICAIVLSALFIYHTRVKGIDTQTVLIVVSYTVEIKYLFSNPVMFQQIMMPLYQKPGT